MATPNNAYYNCPSRGAVIAGMDYIRPVLGAIGHSKVNYEITADGGIGMEAYAHHKIMNALLRKPFDYVRCNVPAATMGPGWTTSNLVNGFYGRGGAGAYDILNGTPPGVDTYIAQMAPLVGSRPCLICINAESNTLYGGTTLLSGYYCWSLYELMIAKFKAAGWDVFVNEPTPSVSYSTYGSNLAARGFRERCIEAHQLGEVINGTGMWNSFPDMADIYGFLRPLSNYTLDGAHLDWEGALKLGLVFADNFPSDLYLPWYPKDTDVVCSQNPLLAGSGGTLGDNASGVAPTGFTLSGYHTNRSLVGSQTDDGYELVCTYSGPAYSDGYTFDLAASVFKSNVVDGVTEIEGLCDIEVLQCSNFGFQLLTQTGTTTGTSPPITGALDTNQLNWTSWLAGRRMVLHSDPYLSPVGATRTTASLRAKVRPGSTSAVLRVRIRYLGVKQTG